uniref:Histidine--tRNA ligase, chloroplastic n=1 Tax=Dipterosiphonia australica TaxID=2007208 RepID=A0A1Z1MMA3_9FLOR|nr:Histidine-tRNA ligase [Dipterosiphonia australica]ARW66925.1 Histidine-tRNA ligase [Dipterosiphonia australica]
MQPLRGTKDILPNEIEIWQKIYTTTKNILNTYSYKEIRTPIIENTELFQRSIGNFTDIVSKEMYSFSDQGKRQITLRPEGTASIARAFIHNKLNTNKSVNRLWYLGPMFRYERPQKGRQRQFHQLGIECIGSNMPLADVEVIKLAVDVLQNLKCEEEYLLELNSIGNIKEREIYKIHLIEYLKRYTNELDNDSKNRIDRNPLRILDSKNLRTQEILQDAPVLKNYLSKTSIEHFEQVCSNLEHLDIKYKINNYLVRGLDYYNYTAFEIKTRTSHQQNTICGGGRYDNLIKQLGGPNTPAVGWAIGLERLIILIQNNLKSKIRRNKIYIAIQHIGANNLLWSIIKILTNYKLEFEIDLSNNNLSKQIKKANQLKAKICFILGENEINNNFVTIKWLNTGTQQTLQLSELTKYIKYLKQYDLTSY